MAPLLATKDYVAATLNAWTNCPGIVKKQLDKQSGEIVSLKESVRDLTLKLTQKKYEAEREAKSQMKAEILKHQQKVE